MLKKLVLAGAVAFAGAAALSAAIVSAQEGPPPPSAGSSIASGLSSTGGVIGPDGALYVAIGGEAPTAVTVPDELVELAGTETAYFGLTGSVARVDVETGTVSSIADGLPVSSFEGTEEGSGPADVAFIGETMYVLVTGSIQPFGGPAEDYPNGVYRLNDDDTWTIVADISAFNDANPVEFPDAAPGGNPFAIVARGSGFIVSDGNYNRLMNVSTSGEISLLAQFDNVVPTGLESSDSGPVYNTWFSAFPHDPGTSFVQQIGVPSGAVTTLASGPAQMIDVQSGPGGSLYVLQFGDQQLDENAPPPPGRLYKLENGELSAIVEGLMLPTSLSFAGDTAYITSLTGEVYEIPGVSTLTPVAPEPTAAPTTAPPPVSPTVPSGTVTPPDTGSGGDAASNATPWLAVLFLAAGSATCIALAKVRADR
jgi:hypothetical protein